MCGAVVFAILALPAGSHAVADQSIPSPEPVLDAEPATRPPSTLLVYGACDNDGEPHFLGKIKDMTAAARDFAANEKIVVFVDRAEGHSDEPGPLAEEFTGARVYEIDRDGMRRVGHDLFAEWNDEPATGDPDVFARFVQFGLARGEAPYSLAIYGHGNGRRFGYDASEEDSEAKWMTVPELIAALHSAGAARFAVLGFDVCNMGLLENAAALAPVTERMVASAPLSGPWPYTAILNAREAGDDGKALPRFGLSFGNVAIRELEAMFPERMNRERPWQAMQSWALIDTDAAARVWEKLRVRDEAAAFTGIDYRPLLPGYDRTKYPYADAFDLAGASSASSEETTLSALVDEAVLASFGGAFYEGFEPGRHGLGVSVPDLLRSE